jgi:integrase
MFIEIWTRTRRRIAIDRKFRRPKGWRGSKSISKLEPEQAFALLEAAERVDMGFGLLCWTYNYTGRRLTETLNATLRDLNLDRGELYLRDTKNGDPVTEHLPPPLVQKFRDMPVRERREGGRAQIGAGVPFLKRDPDQRIFRFHKGGHLYKLLKKSMLIAGLSFPRRQCGFHLFCHTYGTWMHRLGLDGYGLARTGRWKDPRSADIYVHTEVGSEAKMADLLPIPKRAKVLVKRREVR